MIKPYIIMLVFLFIAGCNGNMKDAISNPKLSEYSFLEDMSNDEYFPSHLVAKGKNILLDLCILIEKQNPESLSQVYSLTHAATEKFNQVALEFEENNSEIETVAREVIAQDIQYILESYGFQADIEEAIAPRDW